MRDEDLNDPAPAKPITDALTPERVAWVVGAFLCGALTVRLASTATLRSEDQQFAQSVAEVHRILDQRYVEPLDSDALRVEAIKGMVGSIQRGRLHDAATMFFVPADAERFAEQVTGRYEGIGVRHGGRRTPEGYLYIETPLEGSPAAEAGVEAGDAITAVDGEPLKDWPLEQISSRLRGEGGTRVLITVRSPNGSQRDIEITRGPVVDPVAVGYARNPDNSWNWFVDEQAKIGYVRFTSFTINSAAPLERRIRGLLSQGMKGLILDLRGNGGGSLEEAVRISSLFLQPDKLIVSKRGRVGSEQHYSLPDVTLPDFPVVILVNEYTASASEIVAGALADHARMLKDDPRAVVVVGARTYGKGSVQVDQKLSTGKEELKFTIAYWYTPSGRRVHRTSDSDVWGVEPDVVVPLNEENWAKLYEALESRRNLRRKDAPPGLREDERADDPQLARATSILAAQLLTPPTTMPATSTTKKVD
jgi:carboxyl-terminal processing protease